MERVDARLNIPAARPGGNSLARLLGLFVRLDAAYRDQRHFERLDDHLRRDVGLTDYRSRRWDAPEMMRRK